MLDNKLENISNNNLGLKQIEISDINMIDNYLFINLSNGQNILTDGQKLYDASNYNYLTNIFEMGDKLCTVMVTQISVYTIICVVN